MLPTELANIEMGGRGILSATSCFLGTGVYFANTGMEIVIHEEVLYNSLNFIDAPSTISATIEILIHEEVLYYYLDFINVNAPSTISAARAPERPTAAICTLPVWEKRAPTFVLDHFGKRAAAI